MPKDCLFFVFNLPRKCVVNLPRRLRRQPTKKPDSVSSMLTNEGAQYEVVSRVLASDMPG